MQKTILSALTLLLLSACSSEQTQNNKAESAPEHKADTVKEAKSEVSLENKVSSENGVSSEKNISSKDETSLEERVSSKKEVSSEKNVDALNAKIDEINTQIKAEAEIPNGAAIYANKCASCHGKDGKKSALNTSAIIAGSDSQKIKDTLKAYKEGSFGGKMKAIMQAQSKPLSDKEIELLSNYISTL